MIDAADADPSRTYTLEEQRRLTDQLRELTRAIHAGELRARRLDLALLRDLHAALFDGVRGHAGRIRTRGAGTERLVFGPHRSVHRDEVKPKLDEVFRKLYGALRELSDVEEDYELRAIELAVWVHAEIVRIHPFEDGNGRISRSYANHLLVYLGLLPVAIEVVKQEYTEALNHYYQCRDMQPLVDLYIRVYPADR